MRIPPIDMSKAPLPKPPQKVIKVGKEVFGTQFSQTIDASKMTLEQVQWLLQQVPIPIIREQQKLGNDPSRVIVDNREDKLYDKAERRIEVEFGDTISRKLIGQIENQLMHEIRQSFAALTGMKWNARNRDAMASKSGWEWIYVERRGVAGVKVGNPAQLGVLPIGARLIYRPKVPTVAYENMLTLWRKEGRRRPGNIVGKGDKGVAPKSRSSRSRAMGFMAQSLARFKRNRLFKNYTIYVAFTKKYAAAHETFEKQGSPIIVMRVSRKRRAYRKYGLGR